MHKNLSLFSKIFLLSSQKNWVWDPGSRIRDLGSRISNKLIPDPNPGSQKHRVPCPGSQIRICNTAGSLHIIRNPDPDPGDHKSYGSNGSEHWARVHPTAVYSLVQYKGREQGEVRMMKKFR
jgi:hypothetical protein